MKLNDNFSNKNEFIYLNKFDFSKNDSFGLPAQNKNSKNIKDYNNNNNINESNIDPRLELTLKYLDIISTLPTFITNNIFFNDLLLLSKNDLIELGFSLVERNRILNFSQEFKKFGKKYNIQEINDFFNEFQNLNMRLITMNNIKPFSSNENNEINNNIKISNNNRNINYNFIKNENKNVSDIPNTNSYYIEDKIYPINNKNENNFMNNDLYPKSKLFPKNYNNKPNNINKNNYKNTSENKTKNNKQEKKYQESLNSNINHNNIINNNNNYNFQENESSKLIRQNSKASKTSSYSKNSRSRLTTISKSFLPPSTSSGTIVQKYQNLSEEIDNYFEKYNNYQENKKNKKKKYQIMTSSNHSKKNYNPIYINNNNNKSNVEKKRDNNNLNSINNISNFNYNNYNEVDIDQQNINNELSRKLKELQKKKKELKEKLNTICDKENKKKMIIKYLEEEEDDK